jgi:aminodeoxyfutalosine deaminase
MRYFSAQYIFTNISPPVKRGIVVADDDGTIIRIEDQNGLDREKHSVEFHNGIIVPGFVNCHCHLELSYLKNIITGGKGLPEFLANISLLRNTVDSDRPKAIKEADRDMSAEGIVLCADICNDDSTFTLKKESRIKYISLLEAFGIDSLRAGNRFEEILALSEKAKTLSLQHYIVPHSVYSLSLELLRMIKEKGAENDITSVHFLESADEEQLLKTHFGPLMEAYRKFLLPFSELNIPADHISAVRDEITASGNLLLVHNTFIRKEQISGLRERQGIFFCLCPKSNLIIEGKMPPVIMMKDEGCNIVIGTDSLASNNTLSILDELKAVQEHFPEIDLETLIQWATINGSRALCDEKNTGSIEPGKKPGLVLLQNTDLQNLKLLPGTSVRRLI